MQQQLLEQQLECVLINAPAGDLMAGGEGLAAVPGKEDQFSAGLIKCVEYAQALNVKYVNILPGRCISESQRPQYLATFKRNLTVAADLLAPLGIGVTFEAINTFDMPGFLIHNVQQMQEIVSELGHDNIKMQFDIYHMARMEQEDIAQLISRLGDQIGHIQFADNPGRGEPGTGELDFAAIFSAIQKSTYRGAVVAEYKPSKRTEETLKWMS